MHVQISLRNNLQSHELFGKWRHNKLAKGNEHDVNDNHYHIVQGWGSMRSMHVFGTELIF